MPRKVITAATWNHRGKQLPINVTQRNGCYEDMLTAVQGQLDAMLSKRSRVLVVRLDFHVYGYTGDNAKFSRLMDKLKRWLTHHYNMAEVGYFWVREMEKAKQQHYHLALMLDGRAIRYPQRVIEWLESYWQARNEPKPFTPSGCFTMVSRNNPESYQKAFYRLSYLAKARGKGYKDKAANNYSASRIRATI